MSEEYRHFVRELRRHMVEKNIKPYELARILHKTHGTVYNWLNLKTVMSGVCMLEIIEKIMDGRIG